MGTCLEILNGKAFVKCFNNTSIVLIPKKNNLIELSNFRPISLCYVVDRIVAKVLANKLKLVVP